MCAGTFPGLNFFLNIFYNPVSPVYYINPGLLRLWVAPYCGVLVSSRNRKEMAGKTEPMENTRVPRNDWFGRARRRDSSARQDPLSSIKRWDQRTTKISILIVAPAMSHFCWPSENLGSWKNPSKWPQLEFIVLLEWPLYSLPLSRPTFTFTNGWKKMNGIKRKLENKAQTQSTKNWVPEEIYRTNHINPLFMKEDGVVKSNKSHKFQRLSTPTTLLCLMKNMILSRGIHHESK